MRRGGLDLLQSPIEAMWFGSLIRVLSVDLPRAGAAAITTYLRSVDEIELNPAHIRRLILRNYGLLIRPAVGDSPLRSDHDIARISLSKQSAC